MKCHVPLLQTQMPLFIGTLLCAKHPSHSDLKLTTYFIVLTLVKISQICIRLTCHRYGVDLCPWQEFQRWLTSRNSIWRETWFSFVNCLQHLWQSPHWGYKKHAKEWLCSVVIPLQFALMTIRCPTKGVFLVMLDCQLKPSNILLKQLQPCRHPSSLEKTILEKVKLFHSNGVVARKSPRLNQSCQERKQKYLQMKISFQEDSSRSENCFIHTRLKRTGLARHRNRQRQKIMEKEETSYILAMIYFTLRGTNLATSS